MNNIEIAQQELLESLKQIGVITNYCKLNSNNKKNGMLLVNDWLIEIDKDYKFGERRVHQSVQAVVITKWNPNIPSPIPNAPRGGYVET